MKDTCAVDAVITWVDGSDPEWISERNKYLPEDKQDSEDNRYRDWDTLKYLFRGIEKFADWFDNIFFVTWGHLPEWLNESNKKLHIIKHNDFIPKEYLPTFNSCAIEMNLHRIDGLSEHFVYFNDDMFLVRPVNKEDFFKNGLPREMAIMRPISYDTWTMGLYTRLNELVVIGKHFNKHEFIKNNITKIFSPIYGKYLFENFANLIYPNFTGFRTTHSPYPLLKSTFNKIWDQEYEIMDETCRDRFRGYRGVNPWLVLQWQICEGIFEPQNAMQFSKTLTIGTDDALIEKLLTHPQYYSLCINDDIIDIDYEKEKQFLNDCFEILLPEKCSFEK